MRRFIGPSGQLYGTNGLAWEMFADFSAVPSTHPKLQTQPFYPILVITQLLLFGQGRPGILRGLRSFPMSRLALATNKYEEMTSFYQNRLGFCPVQSWDRPGARGAILSRPGGFKIEILDMAREKRPSALQEPSDRVHLVLEVENVEKFGHLWNLPAPEETSWGGPIIKVRDPDGWQVVVMGLGG